MNSRIAFIKLGVSFGFACSICAATPLTTAAAWLVPVSDMYKPPSTRNPPGVALSNNLLPGADVDSMPTPPARMSGFAFCSGNAGPRELNFARTSSARVKLPSELFAPTVKTHG